MTKLSHFCSLIFLCGFIPLTLTAESDQPEPLLSVDVSFVAVDLKYNKVRGAQICEIQHGVSSSFKGETFSNGGFSLVAQNLVNELERFHDSSWFAKDALYDPSIKQALSNNKRWTRSEQFQQLTKNKQFLANASLLVADPSDINTYHGFVIMKPGQIDDRQSFQNKYPGVICIDNGIYHNRKDKYKMTKLLMGHPLTEKHKPKWGIYSLAKEDGLIDLINKEIASDLLVIKPVNNSLGKGVIILKKEDLKDALGYLFKRPAGIINSDPAYQFWLSCNETNFLVEEFIDVEPVQAPHLEGKLYSPTLRLAFLMIYNKNEIEIVCLGGYYSLPQKSLSEEGTLNEHYKTYCKLPYYLKGDPEIMKLAEDEIKNVLYLVYLKLLGLERT